MKLTTEGRTVGRMGNSDERQFTIAGSAKAFKILSDGLYSDKEGAVIRELSCNAKDSHVDAGKGDVPFEIHLPNSLEPWFAVTDFGIGLCHDDVMRLYSTYFASTKTDSNDVTGCLGLGSKSPFAYVDAFTVESRWGGMMTLYSCFYNEEGIPSITVLGEPFDTDQPNGLTVKMPVKEEDMHDFARKADSQLRRFDPAPIVTGNTNFEIETVAYTVKGSNWKLLEKDGHYSDAKVNAIQGNVTYPVDQYALGDLTDAQTAVMGLSVDIFFEIGDLDVAANREALGYDDQTIINIKNALTNIATELPPLFTAKFDKCETLWEARCLFQTDIKNMAHGLQNLLKDKDVGIKWRKRSLNERFILSDEDFDESFVKFERGYRSGRGTVADRYNGYKFMASAKTLFFYDDVGHGSHSRITHYIDSTDRDVFATAYLIKTDVKKHLKRISKALGDVTIQPVSNLPKRPKATRAAAKATSKVLKYVGSAYDRRDSWELTDLDLKTGGIYVMINRYRVIKHGNEDSTFETTVKTAVDIGIIDDTTVIYGIRKGDVSKIADDSGWVDFYDMLNTKITDLVIKEKIGSIIADHEMFSSFGFELSRFTENLKDTKFESGSPMDNFVNAYEYLSGRNTARSNSLVSMARMADCRIDTEKAEHDLDKLWDIITKRYPLIKLIDDHKMRGGHSYYGNSARNSKEVENFDFLVDYITAMDIVLADDEDAEEKAA